MYKLRKVNDITDFTNGIYIDRFINGVYCLVGIEEGRNDNETFHSYKYDLMGLPVVDDSGNLHFTRIDYDENKHNGFLYIDYNFMHDKDDGGYNSRKQKQETQKRLLKNSIALEEGSTTLRELYLPDHQSNQSTRKRHRTEGGKTRKHRR